MNLIFKIILSIILFYGISVTIIYFIQDKLIFLSSELNKDHQFKFSNDFAEFNIKTNENRIINALLFKSISPPKGLIIYFHGNEGSLERWGNYASNFTVSGYDILMTDYRGYGKSTGKPSETALYDDAEFIWNWAKTKFNRKKHIIYGRSLGAAVASYLAASVNPDMLILETPFDNINDAIPAYIIPYKLKYTFSNSRHLRNVKCKKVIFHGTRDMLIPLSSAMKLKPFLTDDDTMIIIKNGRHANLDSFSEYHEALAEILR